MNTTSNTSQESSLSSSSTLNNTTLMSDSSNVNPRTTTNVTDYSDILNYPDPNEFLTSKQKRAKKQREMTVLKNQCLEKFNKVNIFFQFISNINFSFTI